MVKQTAAAALGGDDGDDRDGRTDQRRDGLQARPQDDRDVGHEDVTKDASTDSGDGVEDEGRTRESRERGVKMSSRVSTPTGSKAWSGDITAVGGEVPGRPAG